ncbi:hypothetical protein BDV36DRAFT_4418 [Aspergillus pseudocaelatus]|uniref:Uncharacterized protein n=1 Tax=Aspergillus pseudocaelatus TaxID=1825620 RepID=A0ABQ6X3R8_9EURO|nr:hypothetical protein BDV36DRAFT_4418 [Aspergillus pseudocaelatus]
MQNSIKFVSNLLLPFSVIFRITTLVVHIFLTEFTLGRHKPDVGTVIPTLDEMRKNSLKRP